MPTTAIAALLYVFLLVPGLVYMNRTEVYRPFRKRTIFRETSTVVFASAMSSGVILIAAVLLSKWWGSPLATIGSFVLSPPETFNQDPGAVLVGMSAFIASASLVAWVASIRGVSSIISKFVVRLGSNRRTEGTAWDEVFCGFSDADAGALVRVRLKSGGWIQGRHDGHSDVEAEDGDRSLILAQPLKIQLDADSDMYSEKYFDRLVVNSSEIDYLLTAISSTNLGEEVDGAYTQSAVVERNHTIEYAVLAGSAMCALVAYRGWKQRPRRRN